MEKGIPRRDDTRGERGERSRIRVQPSPSPLQELAAEALGCSRLRVSRVTLRGSERWCSEVPCPGTLQASGAPCGKPSQTDWGTCMSGAGQSSLLQRCETTQDADYGQRALLQPLSTCIRLPNVHGSHKRPDSPNLTMVAAGVSANRSFGCLRRYSSFSEIR